MKAFARKLAAVPLLLSVFSASSHAIVGGGIVPPSGMPAGETTMLFKGVLIQGADKGLTQQWILEVTNTAKTSVEAHFSSGMSADLRLTGAGGVLSWAWSQEMMFTQALRNQMIAAGQTLKFTFDIPKNKLLACRGECELTGVFVGKGKAGQPLMAEVVQKL
ncbi:BsuPI-related putative proteinase inhibitor [Shewanella sp.]|uniref:BsuPI-related putative proteinase inhibitor n=1 Tax=Shewanella sp. TaxID=50422 RepID=UPI0035628168